MKSLSDRAGAVLARLRGQPGLAARLFGRPHWDISVIDEIGRCAEPAAIPHLVPVVLTGRRGQILAAARAIAALLAQTAVEDLPALDESVRSKWPWQMWWSVGGTRERLNPLALRRWVGPGQAGSLLLPFSSFHVNGYVREAAVRRLALVGDGSELPYLLLRLNDWVAWVRRAASTAVRARLRPDYAAAFAHALPLVTRLRETGRVDDATLVDEMTTVLASRAARAPMLANLHADSKRVRRASFALLSELRADECATVLDIALAVADPVIRLRAFRLATLHVEASALRDVLDRAQRDAFAPLRCEALRQRVARLPAESLDALRVALLDRNPAVRAEARFHLRARGETDLVARYRAALTAPTVATVAAAIAGLAECGSTPDASRIALLLSHRRATVRRAAVRYLLPLGGDEYVGAVVERLADSAGGVSAQAARALRSRVVAVGGARLWPMLERATTEHVSRNVLSLLCALPKWDSLVWLLRAAGAGDSAVGSQVREAIAAWTPTSHAHVVAPSREQLAALAAALPPVEERVPVEVADGLRRVLRASGYS